MTYFGDESRAAAKDLGLKGFWMGYFGFRAAPLGAVAAGVVEAVFANFARPMVARAVPDVWQHSAPLALVAARHRAAAATLCRVDASGDDRVTEAVGLLEPMIADADPIGRPLFAANQALHEDLEGRAQLWQLCTSLREHRGDGHVMALATAELDGCEAHVLHRAESNTPVELLRDNRGWTADEWDDAQERLARRGVVDRDGRLTAAGRQLRWDIEATTDRLAGSLLRDRPESDIARVTSLLEVIAAPVLDADLIPFPNPMGLPRWRTP